jgi:hypothetical protein
LVSLVLEVFKVSDEFFTRADWRPGKKRTRQLRTKPWGGRKTAPAAFLEAGKRNAFKPGRPGYKVCAAVKRNGEPCGMLAFKGTIVCGAHGGFSIWAKQGKLKRSGKHAAIKAQRAATVEGQVSSAPMALMQMQVYRLADERSRMKMVRAYGTSMWARLIKDIRTIERCV